MSSVSHYKYIAQCSVDALSSSSSNFLFGFKTSSTNTKIKPMYSAYGALRFGNGTNEQYMGRTIIRGMQVDEWKSCMYWKNIDATMEVHWYFSGEYMSMGRKFIGTFQMSTGLLVLLW